MAEMNFHEFFRHFDPELPIEKTTCVPVLTLPNFSKSYELRKIPVLCEYL